MTPRPIAWHVARWGDDPWAGGSWSALAPGGSPADRARIGEPIDGRFVLAGDACNATQPSMAHGAFEDGRRAAAWARAVGAQRVVVIGAGFAGLGAARDLHDADVDVVVLEARTRIGGRAHTVTLDGPDGHPSVRADAGAAWLQQGPSNSLARLAEAWGVRTLPTDFHRPLAAAPGGPFGDVAAAHAALAAVCRAASPGASLADVLPGYLDGLDMPARRDAQHAIDLEIDLENGAAHDRLSAHTVFDEPGVGVADRWLPDGYAALQARLADGVDIRLDRAVQRVEWDAAGVRVETAAPGGDEVEQADVCICTVPAWLAPRLTLSPGLTAGHLDAIGRLAVGRVEKVILRFDERWWPVAPSGYLRWYDHPASWGEWLDLTDGVGAPVVAGLIAADAVVRHHAGRSDEDVASAAADALARWAAAGPR
ncbi:MAG: FAD-dependent oxidoreductase [Ilumatobacteraceae bacterium]